MNVSESVWLKVCKKLQRSGTIPDKEIRKCNVTSKQNHNGSTILEIDTEEDRYNLEVSIHKSQNNKEPDNDLKYQTIYVEDENIRIVLEDINIKGYKHFSFEKTSKDVSLDINILRSILTALACNHSKSIHTQFSKNVYFSKSYSLVGGDFERNLNFLYKIVDQTCNEEVNSEIWMKSVHKLCYSSEREKTLKPTKDNVYVQSDILQSKIFFKKDSGVVKYKVLNTTTHKQLPLVYDVLLSIFYFSTQKMRQCYFHDLLNYYYNALSENLDRVGLTILNILPVQSFHNMVAKFTPYVKVELAVFNCGKYMETTKLLEDDNFIRNIWDLYNSEKRCYDSIRTWVVEIYQSLLYTNLSREDCYKIIKNKIGSSDYEFLNWKLTPLEIRSGYLGDYYKLKIDIIFNDQRKTINLFTKYLPTYSDFAIEMATSSFEKEEFYYVTFIPEVVNAGLEEITDFLPKCYFAKSNNVIIQEDMSAINYKSLSQGEALSLDNIQLVTKQLAKLHACSLLYEEIMTEKSGKIYRIDDVFTKLAQDTLLVGNEPGQPATVITCGVSGVLDYLLDVYPDIPKRFSMEEFKSKAKTLYDKMVRGKLKSSKFRNVLCQGDPWGNNFLFKRDENDKPVDCCIVDYQIIRYCPSSHDLLFFLYLNTDRRMRKEHMSEIIEDYYKELSRIFKKYGHDLCKIYTYDDLLESCDAIKPEAICLASTYLQLVLYPVEKLQELMKDKEKFNNYALVDRKEMLSEVHRNDFYKERIKEIIEDLCEVIENDPNL